MLCSSIEELNQAFEGLVGVHPQLDYRICKHLINIGFEVLVQGWRNVSGVETTSTAYIYDSPETEPKCHFTNQNRYSICTVTKSPEETWPQNAEDMIENHPEYILDWEYLEGEVVFEGTHTYSNGFITQGTTVSDVPDPIFEGENKNVADVQPAVVTIVGTYVDIGAKSEEGDPTIKKVIGSYISTGAEPQTTYTYGYLVDPTAEQDSAQIVRYNEGWTVDIQFDYIEEQPGKVQKGVRDYGWEELSDKGLYDIRFLTAGTFNCEEVKDQMATCAGKRGDCIALINANEVESGFKYRPIYKIEDGVDIGLRSRFKVGNYGEYAAGFTPWFYSSNTDLIDKDIDEQRVLVPAAFGYLFAYANALRVSPEWYAIAGFERGIIPELDGVPCNFSSTEVEQLQARAVDKAVSLDAEGDNVGYAINPIANVRPAGYIIWGNRTLRINTDGKGTIATSFLNVRNGVSGIKKVLYMAARRYTFEQNNDLLWTNFQAYTRPLLDRMQSGNGLLGYRWTRIATTKKARLAAQLKIIPIEAVEDFKLDIILTDDLDVQE